MRFLHCRCEEGCFVIVFLTVQRRGGLCFLCFYTAEVKEVVFLTVQYRESALCFLQCRGEGSCVSYSVEVRGVVFRLSVSLSPT